MRSSATSTFTRWRTAWIRPRTVGVVLPLDGAADLAEAERLQSTRAACGCAVAERLHLGDRSVGHQAGVSSTAAGAPRRGSSARLLGRSAPSRPSTSRTVSPRSSATWGGAAQRLQGRDRGLDQVDRVLAAERLRETSWIPASSSTARTPPPAITPVPGEAGLSSTRSRPSARRHLVGDRGAVHRHLEEVLAGALDALLDGDRDLVRLAVADADLRLLVAHHHEGGEREARPPLTTLATRLISTTRSCRSEPSPAVRVSCP